jgi:hypothetical protein
MAQEYEEAQMAEEGMTGPGAPTPLSALEVRTYKCRVLSAPTNDAILGNCWSDEAGYSIGCRWRLQHRRISGLHTSENARADQGYL